MGGLFSSNPEYNWKDAEIRQRIREQQALQAMREQQALQAMRDQRILQRMREQQRLQEIIEQQRLQEIREQQRLRKEQERLQSFPAPVEVVTRRICLENLLSYTHIAREWMYSRERTFTLHFVELEREYSREFSSIKNLFKKTTKRHVKIDKIERIENQFLLGAYLLKKEALKEKNGREPEEKLLFHGTKASNVNNICKNNFDWRRFGDNKGHKFGQGVSFTPISFYATHYSDKQSYYKVMLVAQVLVGQSIVGNQNYSLPPPGYDTTTKENGHVVVKYEDNEFYPAYKITYYFDQQCGVINN